MRSAFFDRYKIKIMKKVIIIGCPGSGKSTFSRALHEVTHIPVIHLDQLFWNADKTTVTREVFSARLDAAMQEESWIIDGNYSSTMEKRMAACDTVIFLDYPVEVCLAGVRERRGKSRADMPWVETDDGPEDEKFLDFIRNYKRDSRPQVLELLAKYPHKRVICFGGRDEAELFLKNIVSGRNDDGI